MENHPIPQDVTGFQFKLIGTMTVKQFGYVATGSILAVIFYYAHIFVLIKLFLIPLFIIIGISLAFVPIEGRPIDFMLIKFIKALFTPNQYIFQKAGGAFALARIPTQPVLTTQQPQYTNKNTRANRKQFLKEEKLKKYLLSIHQSNLNPLDKKEAKYFSMLQKTSSDITETAQLRTIQQPPVIQSHIPAPTVQVKPLIMPQPFSTPQLPLARQSTSPVVRIEIKGPGERNQVEVRTQPIQTQTSEPVIRQKAAPSLSRIEIDQTDKKLQQALLKTNVSYGKTSTAPVMPVAFNVSQPVMVSMEEEGAKKLAPSPLLNLSSDTQGSITSNSKEATINQALFDQTLKQKLAEDEKRVKEIVAQKEAEYHKKLQDVARQKEQLEQEIVRMKREAEMSKKQIYTAGTAQPRVETKLVKKIPKSMTKTTGLPIAPDVPNVITGIVKDPRGNILPNILVEVKDKDGNPVRAFKTNALGQFASATQLSKGTYTIEFEDARGIHTFDTLELETKGEIIQPIEVISHDAREELRKSLFGTQQTN